ncbi:zinc finger protein Xfin-like [Zerene cesonia]|uniref:zinc finger protein Xfin-like n=1 Tax=Zerene cesonia TaxID=33412 RepID=UPI0018E5954C|nr:zinc finger protein Xfin-like [Zerene cesonia]
MGSDESDDEPLSVLAAAKKINPEDFPVDIEITEIKSKKKKILPLKKYGVTIKLHRKNSTSNALVSQALIKRPTDVWLYLKDFNTTGPYSCLLCPDWFINRPKIIIHYVLNHKKDFCGICRYFVPDRDAWIAHEKFHTPWPCSQCVESFPVEDMLRNHLKTTHNLVHCRLCHFRVPADDNYTTHLYQKHNVTNITCIFGDLWQLDSKYKFFCLLCSKSDNPVSTFFSHYMGYHHFTLKCFANMVSGKDPPFIVKGVDVSPQFINDELRSQMRCGYVGMQKPYSIQDCPIDQNEPNIDLSVMIPEVKQEINSEDEHIKCHNENKTEETKECQMQDYERNDDAKDDEGKEDDMKTENGDVCDGNKNDSNNISEEIIDYQGEEDFDMTLLELVILEKCYFNYIDGMLKDIEIKTVPENSDVDYNTKSEARELDCTICKMKLDDPNSLAAHVSKMHCMKIVSLYSCRVCATTFETFSELRNHVNEELGQFEDLWICQFCDKEFDNRESTRKHLSLHWEELEYENCFSPHLGFKCKYCPTLFWNEPDRELHQIKVHLEKYKDEFYKCEDCSKTFGDKVWFTHHYMQEHINERTQMNIYLLKCCVCCILLPSLEEIRTHFDENHPEARKLYCCLDPCVYRPLSQKKSLKVHVKTVHAPRSSKPKPVSCHVCGRDFATARSCSTHVTQAHGAVGKFKCKLCREVLQTMDERKLHYLLRHPGRHPFECSECGKSFQYKSSLYMHKQDHLPNRQSFTCDYCGKVFAKKDSYREHVQIHEGPRHACSYCPMRFVQRSNMLRHERRHTGERPYTCPHCERTFADKGACTSHTRTHSKDTSYACLYCGQTFVQKSKLTYHIRRHTGENLETCTICSKLFTSACSLREHMKTHVAKAENVKCPLCDKKYQDERYMLRHLRTSHTNTQFTCPICQKTVTSSSGLRHHVMTHSTLNIFRCKCCPKSYAVKRTIIKHLRKRHGLSGTAINTKDYYSRLEPRECNLNLDEQTMTSIFGPPKKKVTDLLIGDFVTLAKKLKLDKKDENNESTEESDNNDENSDEETQDNSTEQSESHSNMDEHPKFTEVVCKQEVINNEYELEPTDFVSVKIEPMEDEENNVL